MIFWQKSLPLSNSSRTMRTMSSAWLSSLAKMMVLGTSLRLGNMSVNSRSPEGPDDGTNLVYRHDVAVKLVGSVGQVLLQLLPTHLPSQPVPSVNVVPGLHGGPLLGDLGADTVGIEVHVHVVSHRLLVGVLHDQVLLEEAECLPGGCRGQSDKEAVEVLQHLPPQVVDGAVTLVGNDDVERLDGDVGVVLDGRRLAPGARPCGTRKALPAPGPALRPSGWSTPAGWWRCRPCSRSQYERN